MASEVTVRATAIGLLLLALAVVPAADARQSRKKSIWGPVEVNGVSQFPVYRDLGVGIFQMGTLLGDGGPVQARQRPRSK